MANTVRMPSHDPCPIRGRWRLVLAAALVVQTAILGAAVSQAATSAPSAGLGSSAAGPVPTVQPIFPSATPTPEPTPSPPPVRTASPQDRWALVVGITAYRSPVHHTVAGAADARLVRDVLLSNGWRSDHIRVLTDGAATAHALTDGLDWLAARSSARTFSLFHYSGHVKQRDGHEYLWPVDNGFLSDTSLVAAMKAVRGRSWTSIAGCEAAGFNDGLASAQRLFTASSAVDEKSYENPDWDLSVWVGVLWRQGLRDKLADSDGDGRVSVQDAARWGAPRAAAITDKQRPYGPQHPVLAGGGSPLYLDAPALD